jgi:hypothetical protein
MTDTNYVQWFFDLERVASGFNWPICVERLDEGKAMLDRTTHAKAPASEVMAAYEKLLGALGPTVMTTLLESDDAFPEVNHSGKPTPPSPGKVTLYVDKDGKRVLAECTKEWGMPPKFSIQ